MRTKLSSTLKARRFIFLLIIDAVLRYLLYDRISSVHAKVPLIGIVIGFLAGIFIDRGIRESSPLDNILFATILAALFGYYDTVNGITMYMYETHAGQRLMLSVILIAALGIISAFANEVVKGYPSKISPIAVGAIMISMIIFAYSVDVVHVASYPNMVLDHYNTVTYKFGLMNTTTNTIASTVSGTAIASGRNGTVSTSFSVNEGSYEAYFYYTYIPIRDNETLRGGLYEFNVTISGIDDGVIHNDYINGHRIDIDIVVLDTSTNAVMRRDDMYSIKITNASEQIPLTFNYTIPSDVAAMKNSDPNRYIVRLEIGISPSVKRDRVAITISFYIHDIKIPNAHYIYYAIALLALADFAAFPEVNIRRRR